MNRNPLIIAISYIVVMVGCGRQAFYVSPYNGNHNPYHPIPLQQDSAKSASYVAASISNGSANDRGADGTFTFFTSASRAHNFGNFQGFYAANLSLGNYSVTPFAMDEGTGNFDPGAINQNAGNKFFGSTGMDGGINFVLPIKGGEWRVVGVETSIQQEFGNYAAFRNTLTDKDADYIIRSKLFATLGGYTELCAGTSRNSIGIRMAAGTVLGSRYHNPYVIDELSGRQLSYTYVNFNFHLTHKKFTGYIQSNWATKAQTLFVGVNYKLGKLK